MHSFMIHEYPLTVTMSLQSKGLVGHYVYVNIIMKYKNTLREIVAMRTTMNLFLFGPLRYSWLGDSLFL